LGAGLYRPYDTSLASAIDRFGAYIKNENAAQFLLMMSHGELEVEYYQPLGRDMQQPHSRDEIYVIASGTATLDIDGQSYGAKTGDVFYVKAGINHSFIEFDAQFATWVFFYGIAL
jgi:mannose-6-phosphate isomerase-like protein (cupin superfamily)